MMALLKLLQHLPTSAAIMEAKIQPAKRGRIGKNTNGSKEQGIGK